LKPNNYNTNIEFVDTKEAADVVVLWLKPTSSPNGLFGSKGDPINLSLSKNRINVDYVNSVMSSKPTVLAINYTNPWVINEIDKGNAKSIIATFGTTPDAVLDIVTGAFKPTGKMPFTTPISQKMVEENQSDIPGYMKPKGYALFKFGDGLSY
jgi:beta-glucosidase